MKLNKQSLIESILSLSNSTTNKFWGTLAIIKSIDGVIIPNKTYHINGSLVMDFLDKLFNLHPSEQRDYHDNIIYVKFSTSWKERLKELTLKNNNFPNLNDAAIFYNKFKNYDTNINTLQLKDEFLNECKIRLNELESLFINNGNLTIEVENYSNTDFVADLESKLGTTRRENYHLSLESPFFIQSKPSELKRAPFIQTLYSGDRIKELLLLSDSNLEDLYPNQKVKLPKINEGRKLLDFIEATENSGLFFEKKLILRFIASLISKPFLILTGLSGSGKTKLAQAFVQWICNAADRNHSIKRFKIGEELNSQRVIYRVTQSDFNSVTFTQVDTQTKVTLPYELIYEWIDVIKNNSFDITTPTRNIRDLVGKSTKYSTQLNSFETHLKAAAFEMISRSDGGFQNLSQFLIIPVGADWTNREPLLGYPNALKPKDYVKPDSGVLDLIILANNQPELPHFLILDEMNLSQVERYFADFLSVMESKEEIPLFAEGTAENGVPAKLRIPSNLFIIGTVNIDETTNMFSPKVLDRANTIEFRVTKEEMQGFFDSVREINMESLYSKGASMAKDFLSLASNKTFETNDIEKINGKLLEFFIELKKTGAEFGYRSASEILRLINQLTVLDKDLTTNEKLDIAIMQKLLPKLHGSRRKLTPILKTLGSFCLKDEINIEKEVFEKDDFDFNASNVLFPLSLEKISRMHKGAVDNGYTSFAEA